MKSSSICPGGLSRVFCRRVAIPGCDVLYVIAFTDVARKLFSWLVRAYFSSSSSVSGLDIAFKFFDWFDCPVLVMALRFLADGASVAQSIDTVFQVLALSLLKCLAILCSHKSTELRGPQFVISLFRQCLCGIGFGW